MRWLRRRIDSLIMKKTLCGKNYYRHLGNRDIGFLERHLRSRNLVMLDFISLYSALMLDGESIDTGCSTLEELFSKIEGS